MKQVSWQYDALHCVVVDSDGQEIAIVMDCQDIMSNGHILAAAPDLLAACKAMLAACSPDEILAADDLGLAAVNKAEPKP